MSNEEIIKILEEFEKMENMKELDRIKYINSIESPTAKEQLLSFFKNKKFIRRRFYNELKKRLG